MKFKFPLAGTLLIAAALCQAAERPVLGRLFFTPQEREQIDLAYRSPQPLAPEALSSFDGEIRRHGRPPIRWINGIPGQQAIPQLGVGDRWQPGSIQRHPLLGEQQLSVSSPKTP